MISPIVFSTAVHPSFRPPAAEVLFERFPALFHGAEELDAAGTLGNADPANRDTVPGEVHAAVSYGDTVQAFTFELSDQKERYLYKLSAAERILEFLNEIIQ